RTKTTRRSSDRSYLSLQSSRHAFSLFIITIMNQGLH
ncbi:MAG: hypothetical protein ACI8Z1_000692, partial [Candidatus Azotimanducaceae bacterium]